MRYFASTAALIAGAALAGQVHAAAQAAGPSPRMEIARYVTIDDYPSAALLARQQGRVGVRLGVSAAGRVTNCRVTVSSGTAILDASTCRLLPSRVRFEPARDAQGSAVAGTYSTHVDWTLPIMQAPMRPGT
jgi:protein TonB